MPPTSTLSTTDGRPNAYIEDMREGTLQLRRWVERVENARTDKPSAFFSALTIGLSMMMLDEIQPPSQADVEVGDEQINYVDMHRTVMDLIRPCWEVDRVALDIEGKSLSDLLTVFDPCRDAVVTLEQRFPELFDCGEDSKLQYLCEPE